MRSGKLQLTEKFVGEPFKEVKISGDYYSFNIQPSGSRQRKLSHYLKNIFLPKGYPNSVSCDYIKYQFWDTLQAFCSTITGILATLEVLRGVGVGDESSTALAATITWVTKDGCGHIGRIIFAYIAGSQLDFYSKRWRLYADILNDAAMCLELNLSAIKGYVTPVLCISTIMKAIVGVAGGATRMVMTQHHALRSNLADVSAKDSAQETAVNLVASLVALLIISLCQNLYLLNCLFTTFVCLHIFCNYKAVKVTCLNTYNETRLLIQLHHIVTKSTSLSTEAVNAIEPIFNNTKWTAKNMCNYEIIIGHPVSGFVNHSNVNEFQKLYSKVQGNYMIVCDEIRSIVYVFLKEKAVTIDIIRGYCEAYFRAVLMNEAEQQDLLQKYFPDDVHANTHNGWDLSKHLLPVDEWRICD